MSKLNSYLDAVIDEIENSKNKNKTMQVRNFYLDNALRYCNEIKIILKNTEDINYLENELIQIMINNGIFMDNPIYKDLEKIMQKIKKINNSFN